MAIRLRSNDSLDDRVLTRQGNGAAPLSGHAQITALHGSRLGWTPVGGGVNFAIG